jgi:hypothetical protein
VRRPVNPPGEGRQRRSGAVGRSGVGSRAHGLVRFADIHRNNTGKLFAETGPESDSRCIVRLLRIFRAPMTKLTSSWVNEDPAPLRGLRTGVGAMEPPVNGHLQALSSLVSPSPIPSARPLEPGQASTPTPAGCRAPVMRAWNCRASCWHCGHRRTVVDAGGNRRRRTIPALSASACTDPPGKGMGSARVGPTLRPPGPGCPRRSGSGHSSSDGSWKRHRWPDVTRRCWWCRIHACAGRP